MTDAAAEVPAVEPELERAVRRCPRAGAVLERADELRRVGPEADRVAVRTLAHEDELAAEAEKARHGAVV